MSKANFTKHSRKTSRILSTTLVLISLAAFIFVTWEDYTELPSTNIIDNMKSSLLGKDSNNQFGDNSNNNKENNDNLHVGSKKITNKKLSSTLSSGSSMNSQLPTNVASNKKGNTKKHTTFLPEVEYNSKKVEQQVNAVRSEIALQTADITENVITPHRSKNKNINKNNNNNYAKDNENLKKNYPNSLLKSTSFQFDPWKNFHQILNTSPMVLFIDSTNVENENIKNILINEYSISPELVIVDIAKHEKGTELVNFIIENDFTSVDKLPFVFINSVSVMDKNLQDNFYSLHMDGSLLNILKSYNQNKILFKKIEVPSNS